MRKCDELTDPAGCMAKARDDEMTFVLLGRDAAAPAAIRAWVKERVRLGKNRPGDAQLLEALRCAQTMEDERKVANAMTPDPDSPERPPEITNVDVKTGATAEKWRGRGGGATIQ